MFILENAIISITRNKGRNILIGIIILVIACACTVTLAISNTANDLINSYESAYDKELTISFNRKNMMGKDMDFSDADSREEMKEKFENISSLTVSQVENFATSEHIEDYYYTYSLSLDGNNIEKAEMNSTNSNSGDGSGGFDGGRGGGMTKPDAENQLDFTLTGYSSVEAMSEFIDGTYTISEIQDDAWDKAFSGNYVFINSELASYNSLALGDTIELTDGNDSTYSFEIIGIFEENESGDSNFNMFSNSANTLITNTSALIAIDDENDDLTGTITPTYLIDDYANADAIQSEFYEKGLDENYVVETNEELANSGLNGVTNVRTFATTFLIITLIIGGVVLVVINMINIRERKYEIGVLRTIGISKKKLTLQFVAELSMVALVALIFGAGIGAFAAKPISNSLLASEISSSESSRDNMRNNFNPRGDSGANSDPSTGGSDNNSDGQPADPPSDDSKGGGAPNFDNLSPNGVVSVSAYDSIDAVVDIKVILELLAICLTLVLLSSVSAMISIQRFSPLTILKERS